MTWLAERTRDARAADDLLPLGALVLAVLAAAATQVTVSHLPSAAPLKGVELFKLAVALLAVLVGCAAASGVYFCSWLRGIRRLSSHWPRWWFVAWTAVPAFVIFLLWWYVSFGPVRPTDLIEGPFARDTRFVSIATAILELPGLIAVLAIRHIANEDRNWAEAGRDKLLLVRRLRDELRRLIVVLAGFLTLLVIATGMRIRAVLVVEPSLEAPNEQVILYGLAFGALLAGFYLVCAPAINQRAEQLVEELAPLPEPTSASFSASLQRQAELAQFMGSSAPMRNLEVVVAIALPLLSALIGVSGSGR